MIPRPVRLCNPGAIRISTAPWKGKRVPSLDKDFETFDTMHNGIRALAKNLLTYYEQHHLNTLVEIITRHAPANENDTISYIRAVSEDTGFSTNEVLNLDDKDTLFDLVKAIMHHESGGMYSTDTEIMDAVSDAMA